MAKIPIPTTAPLESRKPLKTRYLAVIALPCCNERETLPETLASLERNSPDEFHNTLVIVNVNQRASMDCGENLATLKWLKGFETELELGWLDHVTGDAGYPEKFGVGLARHQACTVGLPFIEDHAPVISLDADSPVNDQYLHAIFDFQKSNPHFKAGHVNFKHRHCGSCGRTKCNRGL